jgi:hypothetical protein
MPLNFNGKFTLLFLVSASLQKKSDNYIRLLSENLLVLQLNHLFKYKIPFLDRAC